MMGNVPLIVVVLVVWCAMAAVAALLLAARLRRPVPAHQGCSRRLTSPVTRLRGDFHLILSGALTTTWMDADGNPVRQQVQPNGSLELMHRDAARWVGQGILQAQFTEYLDRCMQVDLVTRTGPVSFLLVPDESPLGQLLQL